MANLETQTGIEVETPVKWNEITGVEKDMLLKPKKNLIEDSTGFKYSALKIRIAYQPLPNNKQRNVIEIKCPDGKYVKLSSEYDLAPQEKGKEKAFDDQSILTLMQSACINIQAEPQYKGNVDVDSNPQCDIDLNQAQRLIVQKRPNQNLTYAGQIAKNLGSSRFSIYFENNFYKANEGGITLIKIKIYHPTEREYQIAINQDHTERNFNPNERIRNVYEFLSKYSEQALKLNQSRYYESSKIQLESLKSPLITNLPQDTGSIKMASIFRDAVALNEPSLPTLQDNEYDLSNNGLSDAETYYQYKLGSIDTVPAKFEDGSECWIDKKGKEIVIKIPSKPQKNGETTIVSSPKYIKYKIT